MCESDVHVILEAIENVQKFVEVFRCNPTDPNAHQLSCSLKSLVDSTRNFVPTSFLSANDPRVFAFIAECKSLLLDDHCGLLIRSRLCILLYNFCLFNPALRRSFSGYDGFCAAVFENMKQVVKDNVGVQSLIDVLRVLQLLTYERNFVVGSWTYELLGYLSSKILISPDVEYLPYCLAILLNLIARSKTYYKQSKSVPRRLMDLLANESRLVVVCCLLIIAYLGTTITTTIFSPENISQVLLCGFNVLVAPDHILTVQYAVDYLKRLLVKETEDKICLNDVCRNYPTYGYFKNTIETVSSLLVNLDPRSEESAKIFDLILALCRISELRAPISELLLKTPQAVEPRNRPTIAIIRAAQMTIDETPLQRTPINALNLLDILAKESIEESGSLKSYFDDVNTLISIVEMNVKTPVATNSDLVVFQCRRIAESLKFSQTLSSDRTANERLCSVLTAPLCSHLNETQFVMNSVIERVSSPSTSADAMAGGQLEINEWNKCAVAIPIQLIRLLSILKDHSRPHKDLYWRTLEDVRILPFISFAMLRGSHELVREALMLTSQFAQNQSFQWDTLAIHVRQCSRLFASSVPQNGNSSDQIGSSTTLSSFKE
ncbi:hypothetical protein M3Y98_00575400 [Aphelenchoides besseyi]|nr:hypothetical protein M3Y98_00575400 [Aphelenchoides besseyi]KAI6193831.1 hypothetical protein M3Y96_01060500 [Aphelenchoides besseyi]